MQSDRRHLRVGGFAAGAIVLVSAVGCSGNSRTSETGSTAGASSSGTGAASSSSSGTGGAASSSSSGTGGAASSSSSGAGGAASPSSSGTGGTSSSSTSGSTSSSASSTSSTSSTSSGGALCGDGVLESGEECDDGNTFNLDGCSSTCQYEVVTRMTALAISGNQAPAYCAHPKNALGAVALGGPNGLATGTINGDLTTDVGNGTINVLTTFTGLSDLTGTNASGFTIGFVDVTPVGAAPNGSPIDSSFLAASASVSSGAPTGSLSPASVSNHALTAGPSTVTLVINLAGSAASLTMLNATVAATIASATDQPTNLPTDMKIENPLPVFETLAANTATEGLCGDITVQSLAQIAAPSALISGLTACGEGYTASNTLLDILVGGCTVFGMVAIAATQPDVAGTSASIITLTAGSGKHVTVSSSDGNAYSSYFSFSANRAHLAGESCTVTSQCQTGQSCTNAVCTPQ